jgi:hypothetical protein
MTAVAHATYEADILVERTEVLKTGHNRANQRPWTLYRVTATDVDRGAIGVELRTFQDLPTGQMRATLEPCVTEGASDLSHYLVRKVRTADDVRASRRKARAAIVGTPDLSEPARTPAEALRNDAPAPTREEHEALKAQVTELAQRFELLLTLIPQRPKETSE